MSQKKTNKNRHAVAHNPEELGKILGLSKGDIALMKYKAELSEIAAKAVRESGHQLSFLRPVRFGL